MDKQKTAIIIGASLGGLYAAVSLRAIGWDVQVYERSISLLGSRGGGLVLQPEAEKALAAAGVPYPRPLGVLSADRIYLNPRDEVISRQSMPQMQTSWAMLYDTLNQAVPDGAIHRGRRLVSFEQDGGGVTAHFTDGHAARGDLLVAADGTRSAVRAQLYPELAPRYAGYVAWRGLAPESALPPQATAVLSDSFSFQHETGHMLLQYLVPGADGAMEPGRRRRNWVWYRRIPAGPQLDAALTGADGQLHEGTLPPGAMGELQAAQLRADAGRILAPSFASLVEATAQPFMQVIQDVQVPQMVHGHVVLTGDAAFTVRPHTAGGAAKAADNAMTLARALSGDGDIDAALRRWQPFALRLGRHLMESGIHVGDRLMGMGLAQ
jgi:2-polyprenyl-6-methoxyphenol hydroxylase-like FAD-dependent oxidoreductase